MAATSRKQPTEQKPARTRDHGASEPEGAVTEPPADTETTDPGAKLTEAYWHALDERDEATGEIPAVQIDAVRVAYLAVPKRQRGDLVTKLNAEALQKMVTGGNVDPGMAQAMQAVSSVFTEVNENGGQAPAPPHDPVPGVAGLLAALDYARDSILAALSDEQRQRLGEVDTTSDPEAQDASTGAVDCLAKVGNRVLSGRKRKRPQRSGKNLGQVIRDAVERHPDGPVDFATIARENGVNTSGLWSRWDADNTPGVTPTTDNGRKAFVAAA